MYKKLFVIFSLIVILSGCGERLREEVVSSHQNGQPAKVKYYDKENRCVREVQYHPNGYVYMEGAIENDKRTGLWVSYFLDGKVQSKGYYVDGLRTGKSEVYHSNGHLFMDGYYKNNHRCGEWIFYDEQGYELNRIDFGACD